jgi:hypothetical protein
VLQAGKAKDLSAPLCNIINAKFTRVILIKTGPEDGTHVPKHVNLDRKLHLPETVLS